MKELDPEGAVRRQRHQLQQRKYYSKGPNYVWHLDGYDQLKPFGFAIHECIDGYSRKVLWLSLLQSNNDPKLVCHLFTVYLRSFGGIPRKSVGDRGTENVHIAAAQRFLCRNHTDSMSGFETFQYGRSVSNQKIEAFWSQLRRLCTGWWIDFLMNVVESGECDLTLHIHRECLKLSFSQIIQTQLDIVKESWNSNLIRRTFTTDPSVRPHGRPDVLYFVPELSSSGAVDHRKTFDWKDLNAIVEVLEGQITPRLNVCTPEFEELASSPTRENNLNLPKNV